MKRRSIGPTLVTLLALASIAAAHDVPDNVSIQAYLKPSDGRLQALVRMPIKALIDVEFPQLPGTGFLDLDNIGPYAGTASRLWVSNLLTLYEGDTRLPPPQVTGILVSRETDSSFGSYTGALAHVTGPALPVKSTVEWDRAVLDVLLETPIRSDRSDFSLLPRWGRLGIRVITTVGFLPSEGGIRTFEYEGDPGLFSLDPARGEAAGHFIRLGLAHLADPSDHLLFLFCLALAVPTLRMLGAFAIRFTLAHSVALIACAIGFASAPIWVPPLVRTFMAAVIIYLGIESVIGSTPRRLRIAAVVSGLIFGLGFGFDLQPELQFGGAHPLIATLSFNLGLEIGQLIALALLVWGLQLVFHLTGPARINTIIFAGLAVHLAWHRMADRAVILRDAPVQWPAFDTESAGRWLFGFTAAAGLGWLLVALIRYLRAPRSEPAR